MEHYDYIVVGQGISGSVLAEYLLQRGSKVLVVEPSTLPSSSRVAAGIWNPVVFKRLTKSWMADELLPEMFSFYLSMEKKLRTKFLHLRNIAKQFTEEQEKSLWLTKSRMEMQNYLNDTTYNHHPLTGADYSFVLNSGNINVERFLDSVKEDLQKKNALLEERFDYSLLEVNVDGVIYKDFTSNALIFCEGSACMHNPYFSWVPFKAAKGEILTIKCEGLKTQQILNKGIFILPIGNDLFKVGATYEWDDLSEFPTEKGKAELIGKLENLLTLPYTVIAHEAGIRPSVIDRRPVIGNHPENGVLKIFNGMGTKAIMLAPYFAKHFINFMENQEELLPEINVSRFGNLSRD
jgi:glycine oxidase